MLKGKSILAGSVIIFLAVLAFLFMAENSYAGGYYIYDGKNLSYSNEDPVRANPPKEWQVRLYKRSATVLSGAYSGGFYGGMPKGDWGLITGKTADEVMKQLKKSQAFEKVYEKWCKCKEGEFTFFNPLGPIAVYEPEKIEKPSLLTKILTIKEKFDEIKEYYDKINEIITDEVKEDNPFENVGKTLKEYAENFEDVFKKQKQLRDMLGNLANDEKKLLANLDNFSKELDAKERKMSGFKNAFEKAAAKKQQKSPANKFVGKWDWNNLEIEIKLDNSGNPISVNEDRLIVKDFNNNVIRGRIVWECSGDKAWGDFELAPAKDGKTLKGWREVKTCKTELVRGLYLLVNGKEPPPYYETRVKWTSEGKKDFELKRLSKVEIEKRETRRKVEAEKAAETQRQWLIEEQKRKEEEKKAEKARKEAKNLEIARKIDDLQAKKAELENKKYEVESDYENERDQAETNERWADDFGRGTSEPVSNAYSQHVAREYREKASRHRNAASRLRDKLRNLENSISNINSAIQNLEYSRPR